jgi:hypothetical protein
MTPIEIATLVAAYALALARLLGAARPLYAWLPEKAQPFLPALIAVLPMIASRFELVQTKLDFAEAIVAALGALGTALRGGEPEPSKTS